MPLKLGTHDLSKYVIIITGATDGIGKEMARILSGFNPKRLILPARNMEKGNKVIDYLKSSNGHANNVEVWEMDLADLQSVKNFANKYIKEVGELHMLFNNAGYMGGVEIVKTKDNLEAQFQVNHLGHFLLTLLLLDTMKKSVSDEIPGHIAFTSSALQYFGEIDFDNLNLEKGRYWNPFKTYSNTKLMNVIVAKELGRILENENIRTYSLHPGAIKSNISNTSDFIGSLLIKLGNILIAKPTEQGAINTLYPVLTSKNNETGKYYHEGIERKPNKVANDENLVKKFWDVSEQYLKDHGMI